MAKKHHVQIKFKIIEVMVKKLMLSIPDDVIQVEDCEVRLKLEIKINAEDGKILLLQDIEYVDLQDKANILMSAQIGFIFRIENIKPLVNEDGKIALPDAFLKSISSISVGTSRGILIERLANTPLRKIIIPPIPLDKKFIQR